jgi:hypothetical protein
MAKVTAQMAISLDGCYAGPMDPHDPKDAAGWMQGPGAPGFFRVTRWVTGAMGWRGRQEYAGGEFVAVAGGGTLLRQVIGAGLFQQLEWHITPVVPDRRGDLHVLPRLLGDGTRPYASRMGPCASCRTWVGDDRDAATNIRFRTTYDN